MEPSSSYAPNVMDRLTLTDYVNLEAARRKLQLPDLWKKIQIEPIAVENMALSLLINGMARDGAVKIFNKAASGYDAVVNVEESSETNFLSLTHNYYIRGLGVNLRD